jgi:hypothetical protein
VEIDAASNRGVDDARELRERAMYAPSGDDRYKVYIVDEAHMLTREAWNALLKILEEPPPRVVFVFATTEPQKIAQAAAPILSRLQRFDLKRIGPAEIRERLAAVLDAEGVAYEPDALAMIARAADGGLRDALSLTDQVLSLGADARVTAARVREALGLVPEDEFLAVLDLIAERRAGDVFASWRGSPRRGRRLRAVPHRARRHAARAARLSLGGAAPELSERAREALARAPGRLAPATCCACCRCSSSSSRASGRAGSSSSCSRRCWCASRCWTARSSSRRCCASWPARWHQVVDFARAARPLAGTALSAALPIAAAVSGTVTIELQEANDTYVQALESGRDDVLAAVQLVYPGATRIVVRAPEGAAPPAERLTTENVRAERITALSRRDPVLGAAIDALDLDLVD